MSEDLELVCLKAKYTNMAKRTYLRTSLLIIVEDKIQGAWDDVCRTTNEICTASGLPSLQTIVQEGNRWELLWQKMLDSDRAFSHISKRFQWATQLV